jgi:BirA family biotin operon repressor/biotin-[acetyl-CoA-carboxylase] ligase
MIANESEIETPIGTVTRIHLNTVDSTNSYAMQLLRNKPEMFHKCTGVLVVTSDQSLGRGQRGNHWSSLPGQDLAMSWVVNSPPKVGTTVFNMSAALATVKGIREAVKSVTGEELPSAALAVKWPNDVMFWSSGGYRKVSGILVENHWRGETWMASVVGIGVNVVSRRLSRAYNAVSISDVISAELKPEDLEQPIILALQNYIEILSREGGAQSVVEEFNKELFGRNEEREFEVAGSTMAGVLNEIDESGMGVFKWSGDNPPASKLHSSEVKWVFR